MRGTTRKTNKALSDPILVMGAERSLVIISFLFWGWAFVGVAPHWPMSIVAMGFIITLYLLKFFGKRDPQGVAVFRKNSRFLLQNRLYVAKGYAAALPKTRKLSTIPLQLTAKV